MNPRTVLKLGALLLGYPNRSHLEAADRAVRSTRTPPDGLVEFLAAADAAGLPDLEQQYVALFDFREDISLYLTFQELGDARDRAQALLALKDQLRSGGFECPEDELPDYLPLLLEFLAEREAAPKDALAERVARALRGIAGRMAPETPYAPLLGAILDALPQTAAPSPDAPRGAEEDRSLPYPLRYV